MRHSGIRQCLFAAVAGGVVFVGGASTACAGELDPLFRVCEIKLESKKATCNVSPAGSTQVVEAVENRAYPFGSRVFTGLESSARIFFDQVNACTMQANTTIALRDDGRNARTVILENGQLDFYVDDEFKPDKTIIVETPGGKVGVVQGKFSVAVAPGSELNTTTVTCNDGRATMKAADFQVATIDADDKVVVDSSPDNSFVKIVNGRGGFSVGIRDSAGNPRDVATKPGQAIKIFRRELKESTGAVVTILITSPQGTLLTTPEGKLEKNAKISYRADN